MRLGQILREMWGRHVEGELLGGGNHEIVLRNFWDIFGKSYNCCLQSQKNLSSIQALPDGKFLDSGKFLLGNVKNVTTSCNLF